MFRKLLSNQKRKPLWLALVLLLLVNVGSEAQSLDVGAPTPIRTQSITGHIGVRDVGDSRLTDHYYAFTGVPGDLLITVKSQKLEWGPGCLHRRHSTPTAKTDAVRREQRARHERNLST